MLNIQRVILHTGCSSQGERIDGSVVFVLTNYKWFTNFGKEESVLAHFVNDDYFTLHGTSTYSRKNIFCCEYESCPYRRYDV